MEITIISCGTCPLRHEDEFGNFCAHPATPGMDIEDKKIIHADCFIATEPLILILDEPRS